MATIRANARLQVGSAAWIAEERSSASQLAEGEAEDFAFLARNDVEWLNEHMAEIFSKNQVNVAEIFKTPGKLRGKTPRTAKKNNPLEARVPLSDVFSSTPRGAPSPFRQQNIERPIATFKVAEDEPREAEPAPMPATTVEDPFVQKPVPNTFDSGYFGSQFATQQMEATQQTEAATQANDLIEIPHTPQPSPPKSQATHTSEDEDIVMDGSPEPEERRSTEGSFQSAKEEQTKNVTVDAAQDLEAEVEIEESPLREVAYPVLSSPLESRIQRPPSPEKRSPERPTLPSPPKVAQMIEQSPPVVDDEHMEDIQSPSDGSSPIGPIVRKSSLNFASLPAREPITTKKSIGNRVSRTSQLEQSRTSNYGRQTGGKSLGNVKQDEIDHEEEDEMDVDEPEQQDPMSRLHNKTSTQRLQDQISMLGKSQSTNRPAKSLANNATTITNPVQPIQAVPTPAPTVKETVQKSPQRQSPQRKPFLAPGAFPDDEDDSWIGPPNASGTAPSIFSPRPQITKSHTTDVMENIHGKNSIGGDQFSIPKRGEEAKHRSPLREPAIPERTTSTLGHTKSVSTSIIRSPKKAGELPELTKGISVSNPNPSIGSNEGATTPPKSPSRSFKGSPIKAAKDKFSSVLKMSRGLFASSAAVSADAKTSTISPASSRMGLRPQPSFEEALQCQSYISQEDFAKSQYSQRTIDSPGKSNVRKTRASTEKEERRKQEEAAREAREAKEAQKMAEQLEKARQKVKEEARVYHQEQERVATMQKEVNARKEQEKLAKASQVDIPRATRTSPRKTKAQLEAEGIAAAAASTESLSNKDIEMTDASSMPPPAVPRPKSQIGRPAAKRPLKPAKETASKAKPPTVIRVDTGSQRGHVGHQYHPSTSTLASTLQESLAAPPQAGPVPGQLRKQASTSSMQSTSSRTGFKSAATKALEAAAKKKEQDELAAQRKREAKQEIERQRAANKEEEKRKEEQQRRQDLERQRTIQREKEQAAAAADAKRNAARQATEKKRLEMEKAKMNGAPPPAIRPQASGADLTLAMLNDKPLPVPPRGDVGPSTGRMNHPSTHRPQGDSSRPTNASIYTAAKVPPKRPLQQEAGDEYRSRPTMPRNPPSYQHNDNHSKRRKTSDVFDSDDEMSPPPAKLTAPPIRQSSSRPKETHSKSIFPFPNGYSNAPQPNNLQKSTLIAQHNMAKPMHPLDMAQVSKAPIPFASNSNQGNAQHKTPARPGAPHHGGKSAKSSKSSPRYQNGENIDLPEISTDEDDDDGSDSDAAAKRKKAFPPVAWAASPALRSQLMIQEGLNPSDIFGQPPPLIMEEVFSKNKERHANFRKRTSSANWSGQDRLTSEEIQRDLEARDRIRRQGGWTHNTIV